MHKYVIAYCPVDSNRIIEVCYADSDEDLLELLFEEFRVYNPYVEEAEEQGKSWKDLEWNVKTLMKDLADCLPAYGNDEFSSITIIEDTKILLQ